MAVTVHLHANFPYDVDRPNAALGYLKAALSPGADVKNIYWNLPPEEILVPLFTILQAFKEKKIDKFDPITVLTGYMSRSFYAGSPRSGQTIIESILKAHTLLEDVDAVAVAFREFIDYTIPEQQLADADLAGFSTNFSQWIISRYIWQSLKQENPDIAVVVGGVLTRDEARAFLETFPEVDYAVWGEGEAPLQELVKQIKGGALEKVPRLVYRQGGNLHFTDAQEDIRVVDNLFGDHSDYFERLKQVGLPISPRIPISGSRFCQWNKCKFCHMTRGGTYYERTTKDIIAEIEYQSQTHQVDDFIFVDTDIGRKTTADFEALLSGLVNSVIKRKSPYNIWAELTPIRFTRRSVRMMSEIKMHIQLGFESLSDTLLQKMDKMHRFSENIQALKFGNDYGLKIFGLNILRNLPGETEKEVIESVENLGFLRFVLGQYNLTPIELTLYKGTPYFEEIPAQERAQWHTNFLYSELTPLGIPDEYRWDFFGFRAQQLRFHQYWDQVIHLLEKVQSAKIFYQWTEFSDGGSLIEEYNEMSGHTDYVLTSVETGILKQCDSITPVTEVYKAFPTVDKEELKTAIAQLAAEKFLYADQRGRLISVLSAETIKKR